MSSPLRRHATLAVVIPTHRGRANFVAEIIETLASIELSKDVTIEILVVDSSEQNEAVFLERKCAEHGVRYLRGAQSAARKRNKGAMLSSAPLIAFLDSDCLPGKDLFATFARRLRATPESVAGMAGMTILRGPVTRPWRVAQRSLYYNQCYDFPRRYKAVTWAPTSNICFKRDAFLAIGGFDEGTWTNVGGEDVDIGVRVNAAGYSIVTEPTAVAYHRREQIKSLWAIWRSLFLYGRADVWLLKKHPSRSHLHPNPLLLFVIGLCFGTASRRRKVPLSLVSVPLLAVVWRAAERMGYIYRVPRLYRNSESQKPTRFEFRLVQPSVFAALLDLAFDAGVVAEALTRRHYKALFQRFTYIDSSNFIPRENA
jgi:GT2 family glycosyltransferase